VDSATTEVVGTVVFVGGAALLLLLARRAVKSRPAATDSAGPASEIPVGRWRAATAAFRVFVVRFSSFLRRARRSIRATRRLHPSAPG